MQSTANSSDAVQIDQDIDSPDVDSPDVDDVDNDDSDNDADSMPFVAESVPPAKPFLSLVAGFDEMFEEIEDQWQERALCAQTDPEAFFPEKGGSTREAKRICLGCEVKDECLNTLSPTTSDSESGADCPSVSVVGSSAGSAEPNALRRIHPRADAASRLGAGGVHLVGIDPQICRYLLDQDLEQ